jgi:cytosine/adenosine deaminase-related metal-dependent hydrolase
MVVFKELLGLPSDRAASVVQAAKEGMAGFDSKLQDEIRLGISPHAPYSVNRLIFQQIKQWVSAANEYFPIAIHLAETIEELELMKDHRGPFVTFLSELGVWEAEGLMESAQEIIDLFAHSGPVLFIHCNYLPPATRIPPNATIVYCPRTHAAFGHPAHPFREFLARGVRVALGTDSLASNPDLDVLAEARFVHRHYPDVPGATILHMATLAGAEALGWADTTGSITAGKSADLVVLPLPDVDAPEPYALILESKTRVQSVLFRGEWTVGGPRGSA